MSARYGVGRYGLGNYSAASTEDGAVTIDADMTNPTTDYNRLRDGKETIVFSTSVSFAHADNQRNGAVTLETFFDIDALPTYVRNLVGSATLSTVLSVRARANYATDGSSTIQLVPSLEWVYFEGRYWEPEAIDGNWTPEVVPESIWIPEVISGSPWG